MSRGLSPLRLPVHTESGQSLGSVVDVTIDPESQTVQQYHVKPNRMLPDVVWSPLLIHHDQVISVSPSGIIVDDAVLRGTRPVAAPLATN